MTEEQFRRALELIGGEENLYIISLNNGKRIYITSQEDLDNLDFLHDNELFIFKETLPNGVKVVYATPYSIVESLIGYDGEYMDPMVIDNQWRLMKRNAFKCADGTLEEALKEREEQKNYNSCEKLDPNKPGYIS